MPERESERSQNDEVFRSVQLRSACRPLAKVNPRHARRFAEAVGTQAKTDAVDAGLLARFGALIEPRLLTASSTAVPIMKDLLVARRALVKDRTAARNRSLQRRLALLKAQAAERLNQIERQIQAIDAALREQLENDAALKARFNILMSIPGLGEATAFTFSPTCPNSARSKTHAPPASLAWRPWLATADNGAASVSSVADGPKCATPSSCRRSSQSPLQSRS